MITTAYKITVRRLANGSDTILRIFAINPDVAMKRALERARLECRIPLDKYRDLHAKGICVFRIAEFGVDPDQSRPTRHPKPFAKTDRGFARRAERQVKRRSRDLSLEGFSL